ncbi:MAG: glycoside hydrolase family 3 C-terminal domain-containing protein [Oscillospiraceae bacterium]|nr:glycoside hydrolase family 3 C-terminal domain-containing protein [Oscillospiraceae bacterium]
MNREDARKRAEELVSRMTIEEAASQLRFDAPAIERLGIPEYNWWNEGLHGVARAGTATSFPQSIALGATFDEELMGKIGETVSTEGRAKYNEISAMGDRDIYKGLTFWSPNINVFRDPRWGRGQETYGEDPYLISRLAIPFIKGLQGDGEYMKVAACAKHFAVHSGPEAKRHEFDAKATPKDMRETYFPAFEACIKEADVEAVMGAYNRTNGEPCCGHSYIKDIIRDEWGFKGHFVSDCWAIRDFHEHHKVTKNSEESAALALNKGCDLNCGCTYVHLMKAYNKGLVTEDAIRGAAVRLFTTRFLLGMFDKTEYDNLNYLDVETKESITLAKRASDEAVVMLKNDGILPVNKDKVKVISVIGPNADARRPLMGNYYGTSSEYITALEGIRKAAGDDVRILYSEGCDLSLTKPDPLSREYNTLAEAEAVMRRSDLVILCIGLNETLEGEEGDQGNQYASGDKKDLSFPRPQLKLIEAVIKTGKPFVTVVMTGSAMDLTRLSETSSAILQAWYPGARGGLSIGDIIFGNVNPSGKLPVTVYRSTEDLPDFEDYSMKNRTYKYIEKAPLYPFGFGLTYGRLEISGASASDTSASARENGLDITVSVKNNGTLKTGEVVQLYAKALEDKNEVRNFKLVGFKRICLDAGASEDVVISITSDSLKVVKEDGSKAVPEGKIAIYAGFGQPDERTAELYGTKSVEIDI